MGRHRAIIQLSNRGQVTLPASIRKALDLDTGDTFEVHLEDGRVVLEPVEVIAIERYTDERIKEFLKESEMSDEELAESQRKWGL